MKNVNNAELNICIPQNNSEALLSFKNNNGIVKQKAISVEDLIVSLSNKHRLSTGLLPPNTRYFAGNKNDFNVLLEFPAKVRRFIRFANARASEDYKGDELQMPFPYTLFSFRVVDGVITNTQLRALKHRLRSLEDSTYVFPFGNTYSNGTICWGTDNKLPIIKEVGHLIGAVAMFFDYPYNGDLADEGGGSFLHRDDITDFWKLVNYLSGESTFPASMLRSTGCHATEMLTNEQDVIEG